jgi:tRNA1(Val) A37 N6-methylase TrmN6
LDYQAPKDIDKYKFPNLIGENLFEANFFDEDNVFNEIIKNQSIDFILGNPPWKSDKEEKHLQWLRKHNSVTGRFEIAQSFLLRAKDFMQSHTQSALIVTSTIFYNVAKTTKEFKNNFLTTFCIDKFFDLSPVRRLIFEEKNSPASIVYYHLSKKMNI